jgi:tripartite-type tricarboxylate transporter receptor subunit TctC
MLVGTTPGGGTDIIARAVAQRLTERWGRAFIVDNRAGGNGTLAMVLLAQAAPDGHTLFVGTTDNVVIASLLKKVSFDTSKAYVPVIQTDAQPYVLTVNPSLPFNSVRELVAYARDKPGALNYGSSGGAGTTTHLGMELFKSIAGVDIVHVPYKGATVAAIDVIAGQIQILLGSAVTVAPHVKSGKLKALLVTSTRRSPAYPDVPTSSESGMPGFLMGNTHGTFAPSGTPEARVLALNREINLIMRAPDVNAKLAADGAEALPPNSPAEFKAAFARRVALWEKFFREHPALANAPR